MIDPLRFNPEKNAALEILRPVYCSACLVQKTRKHNPEIAIKYCRDCISNDAYDKVNNLKGLYLCSFCDENNHKHVDTALHNRHILVVGPGIRKKIMRRGDTEKFPFSLDLVTIKLSTKVYHNGKRIYSEPSKFLTFNTGLSGNTLHIQLLGAKNLQTGDAGVQYGSSDPFVVYSFCGKALNSTRIRHRTINPSWNNETFIVPMTTFTDNKTTTTTRIEDDNENKPRNMLLSQKGIVKLEVFDHDWITQNEFLGHLEIEKSQLEKLAIEANLQPIRLQLTSKEHHGNLLLKFGRDDQFFYLLIDKAENLDRGDSVKNSNPYVKVYFDHKSSTDIGSSTPILVGSSSTVLDTINPQWFTNNVFKFLLKDVTRKDYNHDHLQNNIAINNHNYNSNDNNHDDNHGNINDSNNNNKLESSYLFKIEIYDNKKHEKHLELGFVTISNHTVQKFLNSSHAQFEEFQNNLLSSSISTANNKFNDNFDISNSVSNNEMNFSASHQSIVISSIENKNTPAFEIQENNSKFGINNNNNNNKNNNNNNNNNFVSKFFNNSFFMFFKKKNNSKKVVVMNLQNINKIENNYNNDNNRDNNNYYDNNSNKNDSNNNYSNNNNNINNNNTINNNNIVENKSNTIKTFDARKTFKNLKNFLKSTSTDHTSLTTTITSLTHIKKNVYWSNEYSFGVFRESKSVEKNNNLIFSRKKKEDYGYLLVRLIPSSRGNVLVGIDEAVKTMTLGEKSIIKCRFDHAYNNFCIHEKIPPRSNFVFKIELLKINNSSSLYGLVLRRWKSCIRNMNFFFNCVVNIVVIIYNFFMNFFAIKKNSNGDEENVEKKNEIIEIDFYTKFENFKQKITLENIQIFFFYLYTNFLIFLKRAYLFLFKNNFFDNNNNNKSVISSNDDNNFDQQSFNNNFDDNDDDSNNSDDFNYNDDFEPIENLNNNNDFSIEKTEKAKVDVNMKKHLNNTVKAGARLMWNSNLNFKIEKSNLNFKIKKSAVKLKKKKKYKKLLS